MSEASSPVAGFGAHALIGRDFEQATVKEFLFGDRPGASALVLEGPAGIGKTSVWTSGVEQARSRGLTVLVSRASPEDFRLGFAGLADLFEDVDLAQLPGVPGPKREALEAALALRERSDGSGAFAASSGALAVLRELSALGRLVIAIDDVDWLDRESSSTLSFAFRRLERSDVRLLFTQRTPIEGPSSLLQNGVERGRLVMRPLSFGAIGRVLHDQLGVSLSRPAARRVYDASAGNPLLALEMARTMSRQDGATTHGHVDTLLVDRIATLPPGPRTALLAVALAGAMSLDELSALVGHEGVEEALEERVLVIDGSHVWPAHPLLAAAARARSPRGEQRDLHRRLADAIGDETRRALHLAQSAVGTDADVAAVVARAAAVAARRGAISTAAELADAALGLTPRDHPAYGDRLLDAADLLWRAGELTRSGELVRSGLEWLPAGAPRARALHMLSTCDVVDTAAEHLDCVRRALAEAPPASSLRVAILARLAGHQAIGMVHDLPGAAAAAEEAFTSAAALAPGPERVQAAAAVIWTRNLRREALGEFEDHPVGGHNAPLYDSVERALAVGRMWRGDISRARAEFESLLALADERGEGEAYYALRVQLCELELRAGRLDIVANLVDEWAREAAEPVGHGAGLLRFKAMLAAERGDPDAAALAGEAVAVAERVGIRWHELEARRARGLAALLAGDTDVACTSFAEVSKSLCREGVENPGAFPVAPDYAEALCRAARMDEARAVVAHLSAQVDHPWASAAAARSRAHLLLADGDAAGASVAFGTAAARFEALEFRFDQARSLLGQGIAERRLRRKRDARASLEEAARSFEALGAPGWAAVAEAEAARIGGRRAEGSGLTPTEQRVANLVCDGLANKQIAATLTVTVGSVEAHLTRIYAKLGVRSRTDLVRALRN